MNKQLWFILVGACAFCLPGAFAQDAVFSPEMSLAEHEQSFLDGLNAEPDDDSARFALGAAQFLRSVELLGQAWYHYGLASEIGREFGIPLLRLPVGANPNPTEVSYADVRTVLADFQGQLALAEATLADVKGDPGVVLNLPDIYLDYNLNGAEDEGESLATLAGIVNRVAARDAASSAQPEEALELRLDQGDAHWLRGYSHLLMALTDIILAHDSQELFSYTAQLFFPRADVADDILYQRRNLVDLDDGEWVDVLTLVHLSLKVPLLEPERMESALEHARAVTEQSDLMWQAILTETDDDCEWIPNPAQTPVVGQPVTQEMVDAWLLFVEETAALWRGERLIPHWRFPEGTGVNLPEVFNKPQDFDLILLIQGATLAPYVEEGEVISLATLRQIQRVFSGEFIGFALWFN